MKAYAFTIHNNGNYTNGLFESGGRETAKQYVQEVVTETFELEQVALGWNKWEQDNTIYGLIVDPLSLDYVKTNLPKDIGRGKLPVGVLGWVTLEECSEERVKELEKKARNIRLDVN